MSLFTQKNCNILLIVLNMLPCLLVRTENTKCSSPFVQYSQHTISLGPIFFSLYFMLYMAGYEVPKISRPILLQVVVIPPQPSPATGILSCLDVRTKSGKGSELVSFSDVTQGPCLTERRTPGDQADIVPLFSKDEGIKKIIMLEGQPVLLIYLKHSESTK